MEKYEINNETLAVIGVDSDTTKVVEKENVYYIKDSAYEIMEHSCQYFGSSYTGRVDGSKKMIGFSYKLPIIVEESSSLIFFPISSPDLPKCTWVSLNWYDHVEVDEYNTYICLKNGEKILTPVSKNSIENQVLRASRLLYVLNDRRMIKK